MSWRGFAKIVKAEITLLVLVVAVSGFLSAPGSLGRIVFLVPLLVSGALASMSASIFNNVYDMDIDENMKRTSSRRRILNSSTRTPYVSVAVLFLALSVFISAYFINPLTMFFIVGGFLSYTLLYTVFLKRRTTWNIVIGGIAGSFPALAGWAAVQNDVSLTSIFIALLVFVWTPTHFWSLASTNYDDYKNANVPMLPAVVGKEKGATWIAINTYIMVVYSYLPLVFREIHVGIIYYVAVTLMNSLVLYYIMRMYRERFSIRSFRKTFHFSNMYLLIILLSIWFVII